MVRVHSDAVVVFDASHTDVVEAALLFFEIETSSVGEEDGGYEHANQAEPGNDVELLLGLGDVRIRDCCSQSTELADSC